MIVYLTVSLPDMLTDDLRFLATDLLQPSPKSLYGLDMIDVAFFFRKYPGEYSL